MELAIYAHPWDLQALRSCGGMTRLRDLGFHEVALAANYHAGRWLTPWHPRGLVRFLEDGTTHYRPRGDYGLLQPLASTEVPAGGPSPLETAAIEAANAGLRLRAWTIGTHNTRLGERHPAACVENAFGDRHSYALCPAQAAVRQHVATTVRDVAMHAGVQTIELESFGWLGHRHNSHHDKNSFATDAWSDLLLSTCFCAACTDALAQQVFDGRTIGGETVAGWRRGFVAALRRHFTDGDCMQAPARIDPATLSLRLVAEFGPAIAVLATHRLGVPIRGLHDLQDVRRAGVRLCLQTNFDKLHGRAALPLPPAVGLVDEVALTCYGEDIDGIAAALPHLVSARQVGPNGPRLRLCCHPRAPQCRSDDDLRRLRELCLQHRLDAISIYHLGLLPWPTIERVARALRD
ncbi:MAG: hypothetical protein IPK26_04805 [Planctomycetes bacterium]|nr:hypothetical protein [Planctomycetota bacterium]